MGSLKDYDFTVNWFDPSLPQLQNLSSQEDFANQAVNTLEIGSFEGRSTVWMLDNLCSDPNSRITCIDTFEGSIENILEVDNKPVELSKIEFRFRNNIKVSGRENQVRVLKGRSMDRLMELHNNLENETFDFVYVDASHNANDVLSDAVLVWPLLKYGGIIIFDDYELNRFEEAYNNPRIGIDAFVNCFGANIEVLNKNNQIPIRKVKRQRIYKIQENYIQYYDKPV